MIFISTLCLSYLLMYFVGMDIPIYYITNYCMTGRFIWCILSDCILSCYKKKCKTLKKNVM